MIRKINLNELHHVEASSMIPLAQNASDVVQAIIKVKKPDYVPADVHRRAAVSPLIFTAEFQVGKLQALEQDPKVESVSISKKLQSSK